MPNEHSLWRIPIPVDLEPSLVEDSEVLRNEAVNEFFTYFESMPAAPASQHSPDGETPRTEGFNRASQFLEQFAVYEGLTHPLGDPGSEGGRPMSVLAVRSMQLTSNTAHAWKAGGVQFARRGRAAEEIVAMRQYTAVLNLGKTNFTPPKSDRIWNHGEDIINLVTPGPSRQLIGEFMPPQPTEYPAQVWVKAPGSHGRGKYLVDVPHALTLPPLWDWCKHITGQEYRIVTVGHRVVQDFKRYGDNGDRSYEWIRMRDVPTELKIMAREAAKKVPGRNVIAWDMIMSDDDVPYIFEGNTCPGVNEDTVRRIVTEMERQINDE